MQLFDIHLLEPSLLFQVVDDRQPVAPLGQGFAPAREAEFSVFDFEQDDESSFHCQLACLDGVLGGIAPAGRAGDVHVNIPRSLDLLGFDKFFIKINGIGW